MANWISPFEKSLPSDTIVTAVEGYRIWYVPIERPWLHSWAMCQHDWKPLQRVEAVCLSHLTCASCRFEDPTHNVEETCDAGVYAFKTKEQAQDEYLNYLEDMVSQTDLASMEGIHVPDCRDRIAFGKVYLWGKVLEHTKGFRAQYAYPSALYHTANNSSALAALYRIPLIAVKDYRSIDDRAH
jgi:hypothetical protein